jgi:LytS/YehU family sensor histidine kinase
VAYILLHRLFFGIDEVGFRNLIENRMLLLLNLPVSLIIYWILILILLSLDYYRKFMIEQVRSLELENRLNTAQLYALKMQLHPHFLFNAFNTIAMMIRQHKNARAVQMVNGLSDMLRLSLNKASHQFIRLEEEIDLVKKYLLLEKERFIDRLEIIWQVDEKLLPERIPAMILQPIVENAIKHGITKITGRSVIRISIGEEEGYIVIEVFNSTPSSYSYIDIGHGKGLGLTNTVERLSRLYHNHFTVQVNDKKQGVSVNIRIPFLKDPETAKKNA